MLVWMLLVLERKKTFENVSLFIFTGKRVSLLFDESYNKIKREKVILLKKGTDESKYF